MKALLKNLYSIVRHPRRRPALKGLLRQVLHDKNRFKKAWTSLLCLTQILYAAVTFEKLASKSGFASIKFQQIPPFTAYTPRPSIARTPNQFLRFLGHQSLLNRGKLLSRPDKVKYFGKTARKGKAIHAEVQLISHILHLASTGKGLGGELFPCIGCSKKTVLLLCDYLSACSHFERTSTFPRNSSSSAPFVDVAGVDPATSIRIIASTLWTAHQRSGRVAVLGKASIPEPDDAEIISCLVHDESGATTATDI